MKRRVIIAIVLLTTLAGACGFYAWKALSTKEIAQLPPDQGINQNANPPQSRSAIFTTETAALSDEVKKNYEINPNEPEWFGEVSHDTQTKKTTYYYPELGFEISFPISYMLKVNSPSSNSSWGWINYMNILDSNDKSSYEFHVVPVSVSLEKQPRVTGGEIYTSVEDYMANTQYPYEFVTINDIRMAHFTHVRGDAADAPSEGYIFIQKDLIYNVTINTNNPDAKGVVETIRFI